MAWLYRLGSGSLLFCLQFCVHLDTPTPTSEPPLPPPLGLAGAALGWVPTAGLPDLCGRFLYLRLQLGPYLGAAGREQGD